MNKYLEDLGGCFHLRVPGKSNRALRMSGTDASEYTNPPLGSYFPDVGVAVAVPNTVELREMANELLAWCDKHDGNTTKSDEDLTTEPVSAILEAKLRAALAADDVEAAREYYWLWSQEMERHPSSVEINYSTSIPSPPQESCCRFC